MAPVGCRPPDIFPLMDDEEFRQNILEKRRKAWREEQERLAAYVTSPEP